MLEIRELDSSYKDREYEFIYETWKYYDIEVEDFSEYKLVLNDFDGVTRKEFKSKLLEDWLEAPSLYGAFIGDELVGLIELDHEKWNNRLRVTNILVFSEHRGSGVGKLLMDQAVEKCRELNARGIILETQSCNYPAISFYRSFGFKLIGFDLTAYSDGDIEHREFRMELYYKNGGRK